MISIVVTLLFFLNFLTGWYLGQNDGWRRCSVFYRKALSLAFHDVEGRDYRLVEAMKIITKPNKKKIWKDYNDLKKKIKELIQ